MNYDSEGEEKKNKRITTFVNTEALEREFEEDESKPKKNTAMMNRRYSNEEDF